MRRNKKRKNDSKNLSADSEIERAQAKINAGAVSSAREILLDLVTAKAEVAPAWHLLGAVEYMMGDLLASRKAFDKAVELAPRTQHI